MSVFLWPEWHAIPTKVDLQRTVVAERTQFPPLPIISDLRSALPLRLYSCNWHFPDSLLSTGFLFGCDCVTSGRKTGRQEDKRKEAALPFLWFGGASDGGSNRSRWWRVTKCDFSSRVGHSASVRGFYLMEVKTPPVALWQVELQPRVTAVFWSLANTSFSLWHLPACQCLCNQSPAWKPLSLHVVSGFLLDADW